MRTGGALLLLAGTVAATDRLLPGASAPLVTLPAAVQLGIAAAALTVGGALFFFGQRWR